MEIEEGNKLIAEFMGCRESTVYWGGEPFQRWGFADTDIADKWPENCFSVETKYHTSWDWLMPVVEKIGLLPYPKDKGWKDEDYKDYSAYPYPRTFGMRNTEGKYMVRLNASPLFEADTLIEATWLAVIDFIQWYNS
jgi:hypothetical protein